MVLGGVLMGTLSLFLTPSGVGEVSTDSKQPVKNSLNQPILGSIGMGRTGGSPSGEYSSLPQEAGGIIRRGETREECLSDIDENGFLGHPNNTNENMNHEKIILMNSDIVVPDSWGETRIVSGDIVELEDGKTLRRTVLRASALEELILSIEVYDRDMQLTNHDFFSAERVRVNTTRRNHTLVLAHLRENHYRDVVAEAGGVVGEGVVILDAPAHATGIFNAITHLRKTIGYDTKVGLIGLDYVE
jgi:hypothetical protein